MWRPTWSRALPKRKRRARGSETVDTISPFDEKRLDRATDERSPLRMGGAHSDLQALYLQRLRRLIRLRRHHREDLNDDGLWLLDRSIFATYRNCIHVGAGFAAHDILRNSPLGSQLPDDDLRPKTASAH